MLGGWLVYIYVYLHEKPAILKNPFKSPILPAFSNYFLTAGCIMITSHSILMERSGYRLKGHYQQLGIQGFTRPPSTPFFGTAPS